MFAFIPTFIAQPLMTIATYLSVSAGVEIPALGLRENFGHIILTNIGSIGYQQGFAPMCTPMRSMGLFCIGAVEKKPVVLDDEIVIREMMNLVMTADHRYGDAALFKPLYKTFGNYLADPTNYKDEDQKENAHWSEKKTA